jgi:alkylation response protein AidB-like acyl-CoA dehydrogenase
MALRVTSEAVQIHGGYGFTDEYLVSRLYCGARYGTLGGGTSETLRNLIGKRIMSNDLADQEFSHTCSADRRLQR